MAADNILTSLFVVPTGNTLPTTGSTNNLTGTQFGIFLPTNAPATTGNVGTAKYIYIAQGRNVYTASEGTRKSDWISPENLIKWYKVTGNLVQNTQITTITALDAGCNQDVSVTLRLDSYYIRTAYFNGLTRSVMVTTPCCNCGSNPCDTLQASDIQLVMEELAQAINTDNILKQFVTAGVDGTGASTEIIIQALPLQTYGEGTSTDLTNFPYQFDRVSFRTFVRTGPELTTDYEVFDACDNIATVAIIQRASYPINTPFEIQQLEKDFFSYQSEYKHIFSNVNYNGEFQTYVDSALAYDLYYLNFWEPTITGRDIGVTRKDEWVCLAFPKGDSGETAAVAVLTAIFGTAVDETATPSTTSTFTTSSTSTTTTTNVFP